MAANMNKGGKEMDVEQLLQKLTTLLSDLGRSRGTESESPYVSLALDSLVSVMNMIRAAELTIAAGAAKVDRRRHAARAHARPHAARGGPHGPPRRATRGRDGGAAARAPGPPTTSASLARGPAPTPRGTDHGTHTLWEGVPMAVGADKPVWPLPTVTPKFATWSFGGGRPFGCAVEKCERWHAGIDLTNAPHNALVIAPEDGILAGLDRGWTDGTKAIFLQTDSGLFLVLGGVIAGSHKEFGLTTAQRVRKGDKLGRIVGGYGMLHLETYKAEPTRKANSRWYHDDPPPDRPAQSHQLRRAHDR
jgi:hypothetical protein